ncbi:L-type lectin-domain containing receptor kinase SIT2-like [Miscanthus floridulus]|uniref:L-type lectin-domain containing receptor kinase SIT2-like n=1 Tax=Miscanthus floridulus TaxID=154761 RepID=UPI0034589824
MIIDLLAGYSIDLSKLCGSIASFLRLATSSWTGMDHPWCLLHLQHLLLIPLLLMLPASRTTGASGDRYGEFIFDGFFGNDLTMDGEAVVSDGLLRLTSGQNRSEGHAFYTYPLNFTSDIVLNGSSVPSFSTTFVFAILPQFSASLGGHGLAFVLSSTKELLTALPSEYLGLLDAWNIGNTSNHLLAVELDTVQSFEFADIDSNHIGIDVNSLVSMDSHTAGYYTTDGEFNPLSLNSTKPMQVWVDYDSKHTILNVTIAPYDSMSTKPSRPLLSVPCKLSSILPTTAVYAGFSSASGFRKSKHYIIGWSFKLNGEAAALNYSALSLKTIQAQAQQIGVHRPHGYKTIVCILLLPTVAISILASAVIVKVHMKRRLKARKIELDWEKEYGPPSFTYKDLFAATNGFKDHMLLGKGGFGSVFKGLLPHSKQIVAIKQVSPESKQGMKEFMAEIIILGHLRHRNLVQLFGYCRHKQQLILVYEYMPNGSLDCYLHTQHHTTTNLFWARRFHIIKGIASGLLYLHEECEQVVIHRDIKSSNVLLDNEMNARLGDFGLARSHDHGVDAHTTRVAGTWGYIAPELARLGKATKATDVFAFGVLIMEVACGRRPIWVNTNNGEPLALADWVLTAWQGGSITDTVDPRLDDYVEEEIELVLKLGLLCSHPSPNARPCMRLVMQYLQRDAHLPSDLEPNNLLNIGLVQDEMHDQHAMSCPATVITDLSKGR